MPKLRNSIKMGIRRIAVFEANLFRLRVQYSTTDVPNNIASCTFSCIADNLAHIFSLRMSSVVKFKCVIIKMV